ncbi:hypothetical protein ABZW49_20030 [Nonomuraea wenchangensis]
MTIALLIACCLLAFATAALWADRKSLKEALDQARADRFAAITRNQEAHAARVREMEKSTASLNELIERLRATNDAAEARLNHTKEK